MADLTDTSLGCIYAAVSQRVDTRRETLVDKDILSLIDEVRRHRAMVAKFEGWAQNIQALSGNVGVKHMAAGIRSILKGDV